MVEFEEEGWKIMRMSGCLNGKSKLGSHAPQLSGSGIDRPQEASNACRQQWCVDVPRFFSGALGEGQTPS